MKKKSLLTALILFLFLFSCDKKKESTNNDLFNKAEGSTSISEHYEGKIVKSTTGQWYLIKKGCRWRTNSIEASDNYLKTLPVGSNYVEENVKVEILKEFPEKGELLPGLVFKKDNL